MSDPKTKTTGNSDNIKFTIQLVLIVLGIIGFGAWYYLDGTDTPDPSVYAQASDSLKALDANKEYIKDCKALLAQESSYIRSSVIKDPDRSESQKAYDARIDAEMVALNEAHKKECEPKISEYEQNLTKYKETYKIIKQAKDTRLQKWLKKDDKEANTFVFDLSYSTKYFYDTKSPRFKIPE